MSDLITIEQIRVEFARIIRRQVFGDRQPFENVNYPEDDLFSAQHFGAFLPKEFIGAASIYKQSPPFGDDSTANAWRLRGIAVLPAHQRKGCGKLLLRELIEFIKIQNGAILWCSAPLAAIGFFRTADFEIIGDEFEPQTVAAQYLLRLQLTG